MRCEKASKGLPVLLVALVTSVGLAASLVPAAGRAGATPTTPGASAAVWASDAHDIVCEIAFQRLTGAGRDLVFAVRDQDPEPRGTFYESCTWADSSRSTDHKATYEYHFMNIVDRDADELVMSRDCASYDCVQTAIVRYARYLTVDPGNSESGRIRRANALKFLGHFVGDLHQPLHVGYAFDRGGNDTFVDFFNEQDVNLHAIWDFHIPNRMGLYRNPTATARRLNREISAAEAAAWADFDVVGWSRESYDVVTSLVYDIPRSRQLGESYFDRAAPIIERRLQQGGVRLAHLINSVAAGRLRLPELFGSS